MISRYQLPLKFDPAPLQQDLAQIKKEEWRPHFNTGYFEGEWSGVALRSIAGVSTQLYHDRHSLGAIADTEILNRCPNLRSVLAAFACPMTSVRLLKLAAGAYIKEHSDYDLSFSDDEVRLHIPIVSNPEVKFFLDAEQVEMKEGECWYLDFTLPHWVKNDSAVDRIHLVIDCQLNDWLRNLFAGAVNLQPAAESPARESSAEGFARFREFVMREPLVLAQLRQTNDRQSFIRLVTRVGHKHGYRFNHEDVEHALNSAKIAWLQRWVA